METIDYSEGRIAFLRAELKITDAQAPAWNAFADASGANAKALGELRGSMGGIRIRDLAGSLVPDMGMMPMMQGGRMGAMPMQGKCGLCRKLDVNQP